MRPLYSKVTNNTYQIHLQSKDKQIIPGVRHFYKGLGMLGKHFLVRSLDRDRVAR